MSEPGLRTQLFRQYHPLYIDLKIRCMFTSNVMLCDRLPEDVEQLERLNSAMSNLATDNDRDVAGKARGLNDLFKKTPVRLSQFLSTLLVHCNKHQPPATLLLVAAASGQAYLLAFKITSVCCVLMPAQAV